MPSNSNSYKIALFVAVLLAVSVAIGAGTAAVTAAETPTDTSTSYPEQNTSNTSLTADDVISIIQKTPENVPEERIDQVQEWASDSENLRELSSDRVAEITSWIASASDSVSEDTSTSTATATPTSTATSTPTPSESATETSTSTTETPTGEHSDAGFGIVQELRNGVEEPQTIQWQITRGVSVNDISWGDGYALVEVTNTRNQPVEIGVLGREGEQEATGGGYTLPPGRTVELKAKAPVLDGGRQEIIVTYGYESFRLFNNGETDSAVDVPTGTNEYILILFVVLPTVFVVGLYIIWQRYMKRQSTVEKFP